MSDYTVGKLVAEFLERNGVDTVFGIISVHNLPIMDGIGLRPGIRMVMARGEAGAAHMADGFARARGATGAIVTSTGPGAANAVPGLLEARFSGTPVIHITGQTATSHLGRGRGTVHDVPDQLGMLASVSKSAHRIESAADAMNVLKRALLDARTPPTGPVSVEIPIDVQRASAPRPRDEAAFLALAPSAPPPGQADLERLLDKVRSARRPLLWVGSGAADASKELLALLERGWGMVSSWAGRGVVADDHPLNLGGLNGAGSPIVDALYREADLLLVVGSRVRGHETLDMSVPLPANLVQIDIDPLADGRTYPNTLFVRGDSQLTLRALCDRLEDHIHPEAEFTRRVADTKRLAIEEYKATLGPYAEFPDILRKAIPSDAVWVRDVTVSNSTWGHRLFPLQSRRDNIYPTGAGIGEGLCLGIGAALGAKDKKVVMMTGDGGFFFNLSELWTAIQEALDITLIVMNDQGYGVIRHMQDAMYESRRSFGDLLGPDLLRLAEVAGIPAWRVSSADELGQVVSRALAVRGPALVEVDMTAIGEFPAYYPYSRMIAEAKRRRGG